MKLLRDISRVKPESMIVLGEVVSQDMIDSIYSSLRDCEAAYISAILSTTKRLAKFRLSDILRRIELAYTATDASTRLQSASDVIMWLNLFKPFSGTQLLHWIDLDRLDALTNYRTNTPLAIDADMFILRSPCLSTYAAIQDEAVKRSYFEWAVFMAMTGDSIEVAHYATRQFRHAA